MLSINKTKKILKEDGIELTDDQVKAYQKVLEVLARQTIDQYNKKKAFTSSATFLNVLQITYFTFFHVSLVAFLACADRKADTKMKIPTMHFL